MTTSPSNTKKKRDRLEIDVEAHEYVRPLRVRVVLTGMWGTCTKCGKVKPASHFGLRRMERDTGIIRNQPQCGTCR